MVWHCIAYIVLMCY